MILKQKLNILFSLGQVLEKPKPPLPSDKHNGEILTNQQRVVTNVPNSNW